MQPYQARVIEEKRDLDAKIAKLESFLKTCDTPVAIVSYHEFQRLTRQRDVMKEYSAILAERISAFGPFKVVVMVNGRGYKIDKEKLTYEDLVALAGHPVGSHPTCTYGYIGDQNRGGILIAGESLAIVGNEYFDVVFTGNA